ncbi:AraC family transcriptional regulator [Paenibacillus ferrarius]|uniref:helix-turn-helix domain-containing protein n=1 Tax=Paenibacillus ferrarius TaxID=1469647 RepID=UPI003D277FCA
MQGKDQVQSIGFRFNNVWPGYVCQLHAVGYDLRTEQYSWNGRDRIFENVNRYLIQYTISGRGRIRIGNREYELVSGDAFLVSVPGDYHYRLPENSGKWELLYLSIRGNEVVRDIWESVIEEKGPVLKLDRNAPLIQHMFRVHQLAVNRHIQDEFFAAALAYQHLMELRRLTMPGFLYTDKPIPDWLRRTMDFLEDNYPQQITLEELAHLAELNKYTFIRLFQKATGKSPIQYLIRLRLQHSIKLLKHTEIPVQEIAAMSGFTSATYFTRVFHSWIGVTPSQFRNSQDRSVDELYL